MYIILIVIQIVNVVANCEILIDSKKLHDTVIKWKKIEYKPNGFPGIQYHDKNGTISIFNSGKINANGFKSKENAISALNNIIDRISKHIECKIIKKPSVHLYVASVQYNKKLNWNKLRKMPEFVKRVQGFTCLQLKFQDINVLAYKQHCVIQGKSMDEINKIVKRLEKTCN